MAIFQAAATLAVLSLLLLSNVTVQSFQPTPTSYSSTCSWTSRPSIITSLAAAAAAVQKRRPFISGNWKLNPQTREEAIQLATDIAASVQHDTTPAADIALFVPYVFIESTMNVVQNKLMIGAEVSLEMYFSLYKYVYIINVI